LDAGGVQATTDMEKYPQMHIASTYDAKLEYMMPLIYKQAGSRICCHHGAIERR
jgi:hypothetical protein